MNPLKAFLLAVPHNAACTTLLHAFFKPGSRLPTGVREEVKTIEPDQLAKRAAAAGMSLHKDPADMVYGYTVTCHGFDFDLIINDEDRGPYRAYFAICLQGEVIRTLRRAYPYPLIPGDS